MKLSANLCKRSLNLVRQINKITMPRHFSNKILTEQNIISIDENTLTGRIVLFLNNDCSKGHSKLNNSFIERTLRTDLIEVINNVKTNHISTIKNLKCTEIEDLFYTLSDSVNTKWDFQKIFNVIDLECCSRLDSLDYNSVLRLLNTYIHIVPNKITEYKFYQAALNHLVCYVEFLTKEELLRTIFYVGLQKKSQQSQVMLKACMKHFTDDDIKKFSVEELCIICNSTFKTSTRITNKVFLETVCKTLSDNLYLLKDPALFITLVKTIRHNRYQDEDLLSTISCAVLFNSTFQYYSFTTFCHILALFADYAYYDDALLGLFVDKCIIHLKKSLIQRRNSHSFDLIRFKDITRFLWALSSLGYKDVDETVFKDVIVLRILERIDAGLHKDDVEDLTLCILYMWILNYQAVELLHYALTEENIQHVREIKSKTKERLNLLLTCIYFENRQLFKALNRKPQPVQYCDMEYQLRHRSALRRVYATLRTIAPTLEINKFDISYQIPHLSIIGITGYKKKIYKAVYIEVLDDYVCVRNKYCSPIGLMQQKLRILNNLDEAVITIHGDEVDQMTEIELKEYLESELDLLC